MDEHGQKQTDGVSKKSPDQVEADLENATGGGIFSELGRMVADEDALANIAGREENFERMAVSDIMHDGDLSMDAIAPGKIIEEPKGLTKAQKAAIAGGVVVGGGAIGGGIYGLVDHFKNKDKKDNGENK